MRTSPNWLVGNSVETVQWENSNTGTAYPFADDTLPEDFPVDVVVDACIVCPKGLEPRLSCLHVGPSLVSVSILVDRQPALFCAVMKDSFEPFSPVAMRSTMHDVSGMITFGDVSFGSPRTYRGSFEFSESAIVRPVRGRLERFYNPNDGLSATGFVGFDLPKGVTLELDEEKHSSVIQFNVDDKIREEVTSPCSKYTRPVTQPIPIKSINGVKPDELGRIAVVFAHDESEVPA